MFLPECWNKKSIKKYCDEFKKELINEYEYYFELALKVMEDKISPKDIKNKEKTKLFILLILQKNY